jgi:hypothetical protein
LERLAQFKNTKEIGPMKIKLAIAILFALVANNPVLAQKQDNSEKAKTTKKSNQKKAAPNPAFAKLDDKPGLPRVLLIGDSISIGYTLAVRDLLKDEANVHRIPTNGGPTTNGLKSLEAWLADSKWDVIHFNWGLHDLKYVGADGTTLTDPKAKDSHPQVDLNQYEKNLRQLVAQLKKTGAKLIWCETTPVPEGSPGRVKGDEIKYNQVAEKIMKEAGIAIDPLHAYADQAKDIQLPANVHYTPAGSKYLAAKVVSEIKANLPSKK